jgi:N-acetylglutamate synthase-like GNAT family acetyltransferase
MTKYTIREADDNDVGEIARLRLRIKEFQPTTEDEYILFWKSFINENPCSTRKALIAVNEEGKVVAHYAMVPYKFRKNGKSMTGGFVCQLMVDEDYRHELIFPRMMMKMLKEYKDLGIDFAYSLSSRPEVVKAHQSFGFLKIGETEVHARPYNLIKIAREQIDNKFLNVIISPALFIAQKFIRCKRSANSGNLKVREISGFDPAIDSFITDVQKHFPYSIVRNYDVLTWRTQNSAGREYRIIIAEDGSEIAGYAILRPMKMKQYSALAVVDIMFAPERHDFGKALLDTVHNTAVQLNVDMSSCLINPHDPLMPVIKKQGYYKTPESISLFTHEPKGAGEGFSEDSFDKWHITWLDHDSV